jgi:hypothetical protein
MGGGRERITRLSGGIFYSRRRHDCPGTGVQMKTNNFDREFWLKWNIESIERHLRYNSLQIDAMKLRVEGLLAEDKKERGALKKLQSELDEIQNQKFRTKARRGQRRKGIST